MLVVKTAISRYVISDMHKMIQTLRQLDYERYICCLFEKSAVQSRHFAILALNQELAKAVEAASEPVVGAIRLKWWQEALLGEHPVSEHPLLPILVEHGIGGELSGLIDARVMELENRSGFKGKPQFDDYLQQSSGVLHQVLAQDDSPTIGQAGAFYGLVGCLRSMPYHLERGIIRQPLDILQRYGISPAAIEQGMEKEAFAHLMSYWMKEIDQRAAALKDEIKTTPKIIQRLHIVALLYVNSLKHVGGNPSHMPARLPSLALKVWWHGLVAMPKPICKKLAV